jgi:putative DNA methylase
VKDILAFHLQPGRRWSEIKKKDFNVQPPRNSTKAVYCYLLIHPDWLKGSSGEANGKKLGGYADASPDADAAWYAERLKGLKLIEVRGRIKLADDTSQVDGDEPEETPEPGEEIAEAEEQEEVGSEAEERKKYGLPRYITLADGTRIDTRKGTVPEKSAFACGLCGRTSDLLTAIKETSNTAPTMIYVIQGDCPQCMKNDPSQGGRFFKAVDSEDCRRLQKAGAEWNARKEADLSDYWPRAELPFAFMTHQNNGGLPNWGYTHFYKMFNPRQLLVHANLLRGIHLFLDKVPQRDGALQILGAFQQYLRSQCMFAFWHLTRNHYAPHFSSANYAPKQNTVEVGLWGGV